MKIAVFTLLSITCFIFISSSYAGVMFNNNGLSGGSRWDASPRNVFAAGERSLDGGLRYSLQGGTFEAYRDMFSWNELPTINAFTYTIQSAFDVWSSVDPESGLGTNLSFVADLNTQVVGNFSSSGSVNRAGAEIDLLAKTDAYFWNTGNSSTQGETWFSAVASPVDLTSGTKNYTGSSAIVGADISMNSNSGAVYNLDLFFRLLTHEIGHALGLGDVDIYSNRFIDDNYDGTPESLTNSWASAVNVYNPAESPLKIYNVGNNIQADGVDILMESRGIGISPGNPVNNPNPLSNDDYGIRQFLYPFIAVPEPSSILLLVLSLSLLFKSKKKRKCF
ncbi:PEP-CTERM sorting domain-containing protein [Thalassotalea piscium]